MNICIVDTETIGDIKIQTPFIFNIGYLIYNTDTDTILKTGNYIIEQIWHNAELSMSNFYGEKRPIYINQMRGRKCFMEKAGYITQQMIKDFKYHEVAGAYAYNSSFDEKAFNFLCEWFKIQNPFDDIPFFDIWGYAHHSVCLTPEYKQYCETHKQFTDTMNYNSGAESVYRFITQNHDFVEDHTALSDCYIELDILKHCIANGSQWQRVYKKAKYIPRVVEKTLELKTAEGILTFPYGKMTIGKEKENKVKISLKPIDK